MTQNILAITLRSPLLKFEVRVTKFVRQQKKETEGKVSRGEQRIRWTRRETDRHTVSLSQLFFFILHD